MREGTNQSTKYSFPLHARCPSGDSDGVADTATGVEFFFFSSPSFLMKTVACLFRPLATAICCLYSRWLDNVLSLPKGKFVYPVPDRGTSCRKGKSNSVHLSFLPESSVTEPRH